MFFVHCILLRYIYRYCIELPIHSYPCTCIMAQYKELFK